ncbi:hypothetical protein [Flagellimonas olearia]|uniref:DUF4145 domain-containing protein n=1 Tax=Flagellimonas olearia TaxID=552546 RepID=A0A444VPS7_9FLAO|nr:hypothetical protein [Allomuricauda olearia]RYC52692.1 hypothetical protein DN53_00290 [Allomuricauda olearia]
MTLEEFVDSIDGFDKLTQREQVRLMSFFYVIVSKVSTFRTADIKKCFEDNDLSIPANISHDLLQLTKTKPPALVKKGKLFAFHRTERKNLENEFVGSKHKVKVSKILRNLLSKIKSKEQQAFLEEAIKCFEVKAYRASILMTWLLTIDVIYEYVLAKKLIEFNSAVQVHGKYKKITFAKKDDFSEIKESDFIEILRTGKIISNDIRKILIEKLDFRNTCAHPNSIIIKETKAVSVIDDLIENVIFKFQ